ncbi:MAG: DUF2004 domain-containing protein [Myxococcales bacterium]|nr:DUF2004 domain-containing protein [Myxococcales bacterium]
MARFQLPLFGTIEFPGDSYGEYLTTVEFAGAEVEIDLNVEGESFPEGAATSLLRRLDDLAALDAATRKAMAESCAAPDEVSWVAEYHKHHLGECSEAELASFFGPESADRSVEAMIDRLRLVRIGLYPRDPYEPALVMDYTMGERITDSLIVAKYDNAGELSELVIES